MSKTDSSQQEDPHGYREGLMNLKENRGFRYYRNSVSRHWDPAEISFDQDRKNLIETYSDVDDPEVKKKVTGVIRKLLAMFGAGEASVTEDIAPLAIAVDGLEEQMFLSTQMYEESKHVEVFDRYWKEVINPLERETGMEVSTPNDDRWYCDGYRELFDEEERAMKKLLTDDTPENRVKAYCTYQLTAEGIIAQTGYWGITKNFRDSAGTTVGFEDQEFEIPELPGLVKGIKKIRGDEGRHVGFGMNKVKEHIFEDGVSTDVVEDTIGDLLPYTIEIVNYAYEGLENPEAFPVGPGDAAMYTQQKHQDRMEQILDEDAEIPSLEELTDLD
ncbi:MAG: ribonucleoside-diphosphate reductase [Halobacteria archaeon]